MISALEMTRIAAYCLNELLQDMAAKAIRFNGDDSGMWTVDVPGRVVCHPGGHKAAELEFTWTDDGELTEVYIVVDDIYAVVRSQHVADFVPGDHGFTVDGRSDWKGTAFPDLVVSMHLAGVEIPGLNAPRRVVPQTPHLRKVKVHSSLRR